MHWFKIEINKGKDGSYHYVGCSEDDIEALIKKAQNGFFIRLDELLYMDRGQMANGRRRVWEFVDHSPNKSALNSFASRSAYSNLRRSARS